MLRYGAYGVTRVQSRAQSRQPLLLIIPSPLAAPTRHDGRELSSCQSCFPPTHERFYATKREPGAAGSDDEDVEVARRWLKTLNPDTIPKHICDVSFSRSSGPGGQNVNKVSSKATLRIQTGHLLPLVPKLLQPAVLNSRYHAAKSGDIVVQADDSRKQTDNVNGCMRKLYQLLEQAGKDAVPGETSPEQTKRVEELQKREKKRTRELKEKLSSKKSARRGAGKADY